MGAVRIRHSILDFATQPVILWIELGGKPKWLPLNFGYHDVMYTAPIPLLDACHHRPPLPPPPPPPYFSFSVVNMETLFKEGSHSGWDQFCERRECGEFSWDVTVRDNCLGRHCRGRPKSGCVTLLSVENTPLFHMASRSMCQRPSANHERF